VLKQFYYGVCYYPEAWDAKRRDSDIDRIADAGFNYVRMGEGAWSYWEPREGEYQFDLFDRVIDRCRKRNIKVILGTPTYAGPAWVGNNYPEVLRWNFQRIPMKHGGRRFYNYTSPKYLELSDRIVTALAEHYKHNDAVFAWQLDNEFNCHMDTSYAPSDTTAFRTWLRRKYKTIGRLNDAWGTRFWSQTYDDWRQIDLPHPTVAYMNPTQLLDESRFISDTVVAFAKRQADILRGHNKRWLITHNGLFPNIDGPKLVEHLDFFSHDQYPLFSPEGDWPSYARDLAQARSLSFPFGILEQQSGPGGQMDYLLRTPKPGEMRLWAWQSIAHGAKLLGYFRWRTCPYGQEQHWHGILDPDDKDKRRLAEAKQVAKELRQVPKDFFDSPLLKSVAILRDFDNETNDRRINTYIKSGAGEHSRWYDAVARSHIPVDYVWPGSDFRGYHVLIAPHLKIVDTAMVKKLTTFVRTGGTLILGAQSGLKDKNLHLLEQTPPGPLAGLAGVEIEDWTTLPPDQSRPAQMIAGESISLHTFIETLRPSRGCETLATWPGDDPLLCGAPAITRNPVGKGRVIYIGGYCSSESAATIVKLLNVQPLIPASPEVECIARRWRGRTVLALFNHSNSPQPISLKTSARDLLAPNCPIAREFTLPPHDLRILVMAGRQASAVSRR
jgi:beta-galactosidase